MSDCCSPKPAKTENRDCCAPVPDETCHGEASGSCCDSPTTRIDYWFWGPSLLVILFYALHLAGFGPWHWLEHMAMAVFDLMNTMALGLLIGVLMVALLSHVPRELVVGLLGQGQGWSGLWRATAAGVLLDLCSHGILMVGAKLYERGVSIGQVMAFLIASPWNSLSLTIILVALVGLYWTLVFIVLSVVVALVTGAIFNFLVARGSLPANPNRVDLPKDFRLLPALRSLYSGIRWSPTGLGRFLLQGVAESRMVIKWLFIGVLLAAAIRSFVPDDAFASWFGPNLIGLALTMLAATVIEVCSEGSTPIAADIVNRAGAPGNGFAFLMAGVSTDYTEVMVLRDTTRSWRIALFLPLVSLPQIVVLAAAINHSF